MSRHPDFIIIGAMKCATSTLHEQLARQPGVFMSEPKEPNFFSDDDVWQRGIDWYRGLFAAARPDDICGESSTHYTKRPTHPDTVSRMHEHLPASTRFVYVMRHPIDRLVSQYVHEWSQRRTSAPPDEALAALPELFDYGRYAMQLDPYLEAFGAERVLPVFFERLVRRPQEQLARIARFVGLDGDPVWHDDLGSKNAAADRERPSRLRRAVAAIPGARPAFRAIVPDAVWERAKARWWRLPAAPTLAPAVRRDLEDRYDDDLRRIGRWLGFELSCATFAVQTDRPDPVWQLSALDRTAVSS